MLRTDCMREASQYPFMQQCLSGIYSLVRVPHQTFFHQVYKTFLAVTPQNVFPIHRLLQLFPVFWSRHLTHKLLSKKLLSAFCPLKQRSWRHSQKLHKHKHLLILIFPWKNRNPCIQLYQNAAQRPHVDCGSVLHPQNYLRSTVEPTLNVSINLLALEAPAAYINHFNATFVLLFKQNVLGFQVAVNYLMLVEKMKSLQNLNGKSSYQIQRKASEVCLLEELIQVFAEDLEFQASVTSKNKRSFQPHNIVSQLRILQESGFQNLYLNFGLGIELLLVFYYFKGYCLFLFVVKGFKYLPERSSAQDRQYLIFVCD